MNKYILPILVSTCVISQAAIVATGSAVADSQFNLSTGATNTVNGSDLSGTVTTDADLLTVTHAPDQDSANQWHTALTVTNNTNIVFALAATSNIASIWIWQHNQVHPTLNLLPRGVNQFDIEVSNDGGSTFTAASSLNQTLAISPGGNINAQGFDIAATGATHVRLHIDSNHGDGDVVGLAEVRFSDQDVATITAVPEPSSTALLGLGGLALILRRRK